MSDIYVQFSDSSESKIASIFCCPQDPTIWENQGAVDASDSRYVTYYDSLPDSVKALVPHPAE